MSVVALLLLQLGLEFFLQTLKTSEDELMNKEYRKKYYIVKIICRKTKIVANSLNIQSLLKLSWELPRPLPTRLLFLGVFATKNVIVQKIYIS